MPLSVKDSQSDKRLDVLLVSAYAPVSSAAAEEWDEYYDALSRAIATAPAGATVLVGTDANASIGRGRLGGPADDHAGAVGPFGIEHMNASGRQLRTFLETQKLASLASFFNKKYYGTWQHPRSKSMYQLDHILVTRSDLMRFTDAGSVSGQLVGSDHRALRCKMRIRCTLGRSAKPAPRSLLARLDHAYLSHGRFGLDGQSERKEAFARDVVAAAAAASPPLPQDKNKILSCAPLPLTPPRPGTLELCGGGSRMLVACQ